MNREEIDLEIEIYQKRLQEGRQDSFAQLSLYRMKKRLETLERNYAQKRPRKENMLEYSRKVLQRTKEVSCEYWLNAKRNCYAVFGNFI
jgi:hypothetical protein